MDGGITRRSLLARAGAAGAGLALGGGLAKAAEAASGGASAPVTFRVIGGGWGGGAKQGPGYVNEPLVGVLPNGTLTPWLAESWRLSSPTHWTVKLRKGLSFSDGSPVTPADVAYSYRRNLSPSLAFSGSANFKEIKAIHVKGDEVTFELPAPDSSFPPLVLAETQIHKASFSKPLADNYGTAANKLLGTGPYIVDRLDPSMTAAHRNPHYWGKHGPIDRIEQITSATDSQAIFNAMQSGSIDAVFALSALDAVQYRSLPHVTLTGALAGLTFLSFDITKKPFDDVHVRRAIAHCWDARDFIRGTLHGLAAPTTGIVYPWQWNDLLTPAQARAYFKTLPTYPFSIAAAKAELAKSSVPNGFTTETVIGKGGASQSLALQVLGENLGKIGIKLTFKEIDPSAAFSEILAIKYPLNILSYVPDYTDPHDFISISVGRTSIWNFARYNDPTVLRLVAQEQASANKAFRTRALKQIYTTFARELPYLGLWYEQQVGAVRAPFHYTENTLQYWYPWWQHISVRRS